MSPHRRHRTIWWICAYPFGKTVVESSAPQRLHFTSFGLATELCPLGSGSCGTFPKSFVASRECIRCYSLQPQAWLSRNGQRRRARPLADRFHLGRRDGAWKNAAQLPRVRQHHTRWKDPRPKGLRSFSTFSTSSGLVGFRVDSCEHVSDFVFRTPVSFAAVKWNARVLRIALICSCLVLANGCLQWLVDSDWGLGWPHSGIRNWQQFRFLTLKGNWFPTEAMMRFCVRKSMPTTGQPVCWAERPRWCSFTGKPKSIPSMRAEPFEGPVHELVRYLLLKVFLFSSLFIRLNAWLSSEGPHSRSLILSLIWANGGAMRLR